VFNAIVNPSYNMLIIKIFSLKNHAFTNTPKLPIHEAKDYILSQLPKKKILIIIGDTGSGKTTQIAQFIHEKFNSKYLYIACTQPRRIAAMTISLRVSKETNTPLGELVGFSVRFENCYSTRTKIKFLTEGVLLREISNDPLITKYTIFIIDEAHERTLCTDILIGSLKEILRVRKYIKLIIMSATLEVDHFFNYFWKTHTIMVPGRLYRVDLFYSLKPLKNYLKTAILLVMGLKKYIDKGIILLFLTGEDEIEEFCIILQRLTRMYEVTLEIYPLYSNLSFKYQNIIMEVNTTSK